ncbi:MAG: V-type ATP synthase subunit I [Bacillota bacterium]
MKKVALAACLSLREEVTCRLQDLGVLELVDVGEDLQRGMPLSVARDRLDRLTGALKYLEGFTSRRKGLVETFVTVKDPVTPEEFDLITSTYDEEGIVKDCLAGEARLAEIGHRRQQLQDTVTCLSPWLGLNVPVESLEAQDRVCLALGWMANKDVVALAEASLTLPMHVEKVSQEGSRTYVAIFLLAGHPEARDLLERSQITRASFEGLRGTPQQLVDRATEEIRHLDIEEEQIRKKAHGMLEETTNLRALHDNLVFQAERAGATELFTHTQRAFVIRGWVRAKHMPQLEHAFRDLGSRVSILSEDPGEGDDPPVVLENPALIQPFEVVTNLYGNPRYGEVDPTPLLAPFFFVFFGLSLSDGGYGLVLTLLCLYMLKKMDIPEGGKRLFRLLALGGVSTVVFGALTGSWFGNAVQILPFEALKALSARITLFDPLRNPLAVLGLALGMGVLQVWFGILVKMVIDIREGRVLEGLLDQGSWLIFIASVAFFAFEGQLLGTGLGRYLVIAGALLVMFAAGRRQKSLLLKPFSAVLGLYGVVGYVGDVLSYARLLALGLATGVIAMVVNQIAQLPQGIPVVGIVLSILIMAGGHSFNLLVSTLGSFIHSGRLQFVEFFTKFFEGGGKTFRPFRKEGRFTAVKG